jgi:hypothetical protein
MPSLRVPPCRQQCRGSWLGWSPAPVVGSLVGAYNKHGSGGMTPWPRKLPNTLLGPETTGPLVPPFGVEPIPVAGWGVVVASPVLVVGCGV